MNELTPNQRDWLAKVFTNSFWDLARSDEWFQDQVESEELGASFSKEFFRERTEMFMAIDRFADYIGYPRMFNHLYEREEDE